MEASPNVQSKSNELLLAAGLGDVQQIKRLLPQHKEEDVARQVVLHVAEDDFDGQGPAAAIADADADAAVTATGDSILHVVACGGHARFLECATVIFGRANHLLGARNGNGDTPLHCAARLGHARMVTHLLGLARARHGDGGEVVKGILRTQNGKGETVLHEAIRLEDKDMVGVLLSADSQLARVPVADGISPLYLSLLLGLGDIARQLFVGDEAVSYSGPDGRNAFHAAILGTPGKESIEMLLERNKDLIRQGERSTGSTPLHWAAKWEGPIRLLLKADPAAAYLQDSDWSFPIHVAALEGKADAVLALLESSPCCAELRDGKGRTFLHVAATEAEEEFKVSLVRKACIWHGKLFASSSMNIQDDEGNTALHLAVLAGNIDAVRALVSVPEVKLTLRNNKRETPKETAFIRVHRARSSVYSWNSRYRIFLLLRDATGVSSRFILPKRDDLGEMERSQNIAGHTQIIGLGSVLITTVTFAAAFAVPGGYRADDHDKGGTPTLAGHHFFDAFVIANTLAFICSALSMLFLMYAGVVGSDVERRMWSLSVSVNLLASSARGLVASFIFGMYSILAPVDRKTALFSCIITVVPLGVVEMGLSYIMLIMVHSDKVVMTRRFVNLQGWWRLRVLAVPVLAILWKLISQFWPYIIIQATFH